MKKILFLILLMPLLASAQQKIGHLTIFSEDGDKFFVVLNGEKQNNVALSNIRIEELPQPYYSAKIIFEDPSIEPIVKKNLMVTDADGRMMDVTYRIRKDKAGKVKLNPYTAIEVQPDFIAPAGTTVVHYGTPYETVTTTSTSTANASINVGGVNMTIDINDPVDQTTTTTRTTTRTTTSSNTNYNQNTNNNNNRCRWAMSSSDFSAAKKSITSANFDDTKLSTAKSIIGSNCLTSDQVVEICNLFNFEETKLSFAKLAYKRTTDQSNYFKVSNVFSFDSNKEELSNYISNE